MTMDKEDIEKAAAEYANEACRPLWRTGNEQVCMTDFIEGVKWRINSVGQFTGLTDKKGREIYEGDVLRINNGAVICLLVVTWNAEVGSWCLRFKEELKEGTRPLGRWLCDRDYDIELTGNIYDNKELLED